MSRSQKRLAGLVALLLSAALIAWMTCYQKGEPQDLVISTGTKGGTYIKLGQLLAPILEESGGAIGTVSWVPSDGSFQNIERLQYAGENLCEPPREGRDADAPKPDGPRDDSNCKAHLAFVVAPAAADRPDVRVLMTLYADVLQLVVCEENPEDPKIRNVSDLDHRRIVVGNKGSATRWISEAVLRNAGISGYTTVPAEGFHGAFEKLRDKLADAAFFMAATPVEAVSNAMGLGRCRLLNVEEDGDVKDLHLRYREIPPLVYENQPELVKTWEASALLVARGDRKDLPDAVVKTILHVLLARIDEFAVANIRVDEIKLWNVFEPPGVGLELHPEAKRFEEMEKHTLLIATGSLGGKYHQVGKTIQLLLQQRVIRTLGGALAVLWEKFRANPSDVLLLLAADRSPVRVVHTDGSLENASLLEQRPTLAIMQYDIALASRLDQSSIYRTDLPNVDFTALPNLKRIATLHKETLYVIARREELPDEKPTLRDLAGKTVCLGPEHSGTRVIAEAVLKHHKISNITPSYLMVPDMVQRLHSGEIAAGFFVSGLPSRAIETLLENPDLRLLSLGSRERAQIVGSAPFYADSIPAGTYACQRDTEPDIQTIATRAVLVTNADLPFDVEAITRAIFEGAAFLDVGESELEVTTSSIATGEDPRQQLLRFLAQDLPSLPLHPEAEAYYKTQDFIQSPPRVDWLTVAWRSLAILVFLFAGYRGFATWRRERTAAKISKEILSVPLGANYEHSAEDLLRIRREIRERAHRHPYQRGQLDEARSRTLVELIAEKIEVAKLNLQSSLLQELRAFRTSERDPTTRLPNLADLEERIWVHLENGELNASQHQLILEFIRENGQGRPTQTGGVRDLDRSESAGRGHSRPSQHGGTNDRL